MIKQGKTLPAKRNKPKKVQNTQTEVTNEVTGEKETKQLGKRTPVSAQKASGIQAKPGYVSRQIVEKPGRLHKFLAAGYTLIEDKNRLVNDSRLQKAEGVGSTCREVVNWSNLSPHDSSTAVWVEIPQDLYEQDQDAKLRSALEIEESINPKKLHANNPDVFYTSTFKKSKDND